MPTAITKGKLNSYDLHVLLHLTWRSLDTVSTIETLNSVCTSERNKERPGRPVVHRTVAWCLGIYFAFLICCLHSNFKQKWVANFLKNHHSIQFPPPFFSLLICPHVLGLIKFEQNHIRSMEEGVELRENPHFPYRKSLFSRQCLKVLKIIKKHYKCIVSEWVKSLSYVQLFATPWTVAYQAPLSMGFSRQ